MNASIITGSLSNVATLVTSNYNYDKTTFAHNRIARLKNGDRVSGKFGDDINELIADYIEAAPNHKFSGTKMLRYFYNNFEVDSKRFYHSSVQSTCSNFEDACTKVQTEYSCNSRQNIVR